MDNDDWGMLTKHVIKTGLSEIKESPNGVHGCVRLELKGMGLSTLEGDLSGYTMLEYLDVSNNKIADISAIEGLTNLLAIKCQNNALTTLGNFSKMTNLQVAEFDNNQIESLFNFSCPHTKAVTLSRNRIFSLTDITEINTSLRVLGLAWNALTNTAGIEKLPNLTTLDLRGNQIKSLDGLASLKNLRQIDLRDNQLPGMASLAVLSGLAELSFLATTGNPLIHPEEADVEALVLEVLILLPQLKNWNDIEFNEEHRTAAEALREERRVAKEAADAEAAAAAAAAAEEEAAKEDGEEGDY